MPAHWSEPENVGLKLRHVLESASFESGQGIFIPDAMHVFGVRQHMHKRATGSCRLFQRQRRHCADLPHAQTGRLAKYTLRTPAPGNAGLEAHAASGNSVHFPYRPPNRSPVLPESPSRPLPMDDCMNLGWREWLGLPLLGIASIKAKLDTGARSSALNVESLETFNVDGQLHVRFSVRTRRRGDHTVICSAPVCDRRPVIDSGGHRDERWFIRTDILLSGRCFSAEMNLSDRRAMLFPLLLGRSALDGRFRVDPALSYTCPRPPRSSSPSPPEPT
jgi:hypothetical protein